MVGSTMTVERVANGWVIMGFGHTYLARDVSEVAALCMRWANATDAFTRETTPFDVQWSGVPTTDGA